MFITISTISVPELHFPRPPSSVIFHSACSAMHSGISEDSIAFPFGAALKCCLGMVLEKSNRSKVTTKIRRVIRVKSELSCWTAICMRVEILFRFVLPILLSFSVSSLYLSWFLAYRFASSAEEEGVWLPFTFIAYVCIFLGGKLPLHYKDKH